MEKVTTVDEKGRVTIPVEFREDLGNEVVVTKTKVGILLTPGRKRDLVAELLKLLESEPRRTGKPTNPSPAKMKGIWREKTV